MSKHHSDYVLVYCTPLSECLEWDLYSPWHVLAASTHRAHLMVIMDMIYKGKFLTLSGIEYRKLQYMIIKFDNNGEFEDHVYYHYQRTDKW